MVELKKPPLGITPRWLLDEEREAEIWRAITRYTIAGYPIPMEWYQELDEIIGRLSKFYHIEYYKIYEIHKPIYERKDYE